MSGTVTLSEALDLLASRKTVVLATCSGSGPALRPMTLQVREGRIFMLTFPDSPKVDHVRRNPRCQIYADLAEGENQGFVRLSCTPEVIADPSLRKAVFTQAPYARTFWESSDDPRFCLLGFSPVGGDVLKPGEMYTRTITMEM
ncbi:MAG: pyridoxamine 5'-phosphate oxidase family protein [Candidatus Fermentibacter sp.]|nr:pyridoxamine 5'-phosphate oxidase family protein [Candidatus Fermentibacter sp.]